MVEVHILERFVYRYGNPVNAEKEYSHFAQYYAKTFNGQCACMYNVHNGEVQIGGSLLCIAPYPLAGVINVLLKQLEVKRQGNCVSSRVVQGIFNYLLEV